MVCRVSRLYSGITMRQLILILFLTGTCFTALASAQTDELQRHHVTVGIGPVIPVGNTGNFLSTAPLLSAGYGYRFTRSRADVGFHVAFGAANNQNGELTYIGQVQGGDHEYTIPPGFRYNMANPFRQTGFSARGGAVYLPLSGDYSSACYSCTSRGGWGGYGPGHASYFLGGNHTFHIGTMFEFNAPSTNGQSVGNVPGIQTRDHWSNLSLEFGLSF